MNKKIKLIKIKKHIATYEQKHIATYTYTLDIYDQKTIKLIKKQSRGGGSHSGGG